MQVNIELLKEKIAASGLNIKKVAEMIGIDESTFYRKLKANGETFTVKEVYAIIDILDIDKSAAGEIFFSQKLA